MGRESEREKEVVVAVAVAVATTFAAAATLRADALLRSEQSCEGRRRQTGGRAAAVVARIRRVGAPCAVGEGRRIRPKRSADEDLRR